MYSILVYRYCTVLLDHTVTLVQIGRTPGRPGDLYESHSTSINTVLYMYTASYPYPYLTHWPYRL